MKKSYLNSTIKQSWSQAGNYQYKNGVVTCRQTLQLLLLNPSKDFLLSKHYNEVK